MEGDNRPMIKKLFSLLFLLTFGVNAFSAELLTYDMDNWMDSLTQKQIDEHNNKDADFQRQYDAREQRGDIIEVRPDGYWTGYGGYPAKGFDHNAYRVIALPGVAVKDVKHYSDSIVIEQPLAGHSEARPVVLKESRMNISTGGNNKVISVNDITTLQKIDTFLTITP